VDKTQAIVAIFGIIFGTGSLVGLAWAITYGIVKGRRTGTLSDATVARLEQRLERMELALDAVAVEVERVAEGQRFATKLLSERSEGVGAPRPQG
jgi:hypothetical protein